MVDQAERKILDMVEQGQITADEGLRLINAMHKNHTDEKSGAVPVEGGNAYVPPADSESEHGPTIPKEEMDRMKAMKRWWVLPFGIGLLATVLGAVWMYNGYVAKGFGAGFWFSWIPFLLGIGIVAVSFPTNRGVWLHVRIKQKPGESPQRISISIPMPIRLAKWAFSTFGDKIPDINGRPMDEISAILEGLSPEEPFYVHVNDEDGEAVEVFIG